MKVNVAAGDYIRMLKLEPHIEGGYFRELYRNDSLITVMQNDAGNSDERNLATTIYFLLRSGETSKFHELKSDEIWFYHTGGHLTVHQIYPDGALVNTVMGNDVSSGQVPQLIIPAGVIFGAEVQGSDTFALVSCMVAPGFDYRDFRLCDSDDLLTRFPIYREVIGRINLI